MFAIKSVKRTTEKVAYAVRPFSRPLHGLRFHSASHPSSQLLGYCHSSASRTSATFQVSFQKFAKASTAAS